MAGQPGSQEKQRRSSNEYWVLRGLYGATYIGLSVAFVWYVFATDDRPRLDDAAFKFAILLILLAVFPWASSIKVFDALEIKKGVSQVREEVSALRMHVAALSSATASSLAQTTVNVNAAAAQATEMKTRLEQEIPNAEKAIAEVAERYGPRVSWDWHDIVSLGVRIDDLVAKLYEQATGQVAGPQWMTLLQAAELSHRGVIDDSTLEALQAFLEIRNMTVHTPTWTIYVKNLEDFIELGMAILARLEMQLDEASGEPLAPKQ